MNDSRTIHLNLYSDKAENIMRTFKDMLVNYWGGTRIRRAGGAVKIERAPNGEVVLTTRSDRWSRTLLWDKHNTDADSREWIAWMLKNMIGREVEYLFRHSGKDVIKQEFKKLWLRGNESESSVYTRYSMNGKTITIRELYAIYDALKARPNMERKYTKDFLEEIIGTQRDPIMTEMEIARREEVERIKAEYAAKMAAMNPDSYGSEEYQRIQNIIRDLKDKARRKCAEIEAEMNDKIAEVNASMNMAMMMGSAA